TSLAKLAPSHCRRLAGRSKGELSIWRDTKKVFFAKLQDLHQVWDSVSWKIAQGRDNPACADMEHAAIGDPQDAGLHLHLTDIFKQNWQVAGIESASNAMNLGATGGIQLATSGSQNAPTVLTQRPRVAILREQGVNSHIEMAYCFDAAGFEAIDVHMTDLQTGRVRLADMQGLVACGGFSYGDTLGAGIGWARSITFNAQLRDQFEGFFKRDSSFGLGVCNGCQMFAELAEIIPGAQDWPRFTHNVSARFEARLSMVEVLDSPSLFFKDMADCRIPIAVAHGEGFANFDAGQGGRGNSERVISSMRFVNNQGQATEQYPANPNGSPGGLTAVTTADGRFTAMMPHPERVFRNVQMSWNPSASGSLEAHSPWIQMWRNARNWLG
ncbi:MAG: phosphoribosylformylglycinamidine synthase, partial [Brachymonas sp.]|nr:phosphoribosylformylglycinamidine synthase [Brachymonas sp.]